MRTVTRSPARATRPGFTLVELIIAMLLFAIIGGAIVKTLSTGQRAYDAQVQHTDMQQNVRLGAGLLPGELRELDASDGDILAMDDVSMRIRSMRQMGIVCTLPALGGALTGTNVLTGVTFAVRDTMQGIRYFSQADSVLIYYEGDPKSRTDDVWLAASLTTDPGAGALTNCADGSGKQGRQFTASIFFDLTLSPPPPNNAGTITVGSPIRAFQPVTYKRVKVGSNWYVGFDSAGVASTEQPLVGPLTDSLGLKFTYYDSSDVKLVLPYDDAKRKQVARISIALALKTAAPVRKNIGTPAPDTSRVTLEVALRNNRRF
jgi:prepilin-type N-terminal cleavage/methylation domain-containing protein